MHNFKANILWNIRDGIENNQYDCIEKTPDTVAKKVLDSEKPGAGEN